MLRAQRLQERDDAGGGPEMRFVRLLTTLYRASRTPLRITSTHFVPVDSRSRILLANSSDSIIQPLVEDSPGHPHPNSAPSGPPQDRVCRGSDSYRRALDSLNRRENIVTQAAL